ncbi:armadillo repeat-containing protein 6-like [Diaphorina citri]|uniref:Armadillo repeat-containing protein 6-like n=1 Tax=Diaphorina citri TaxID=121845 RepID=A0A1S4EIA2_DIACI|nr:armadillo repeat-containing protein 6-like [Diaphorina citri]
MSAENGKPMKHIIDQATFDEAVNENIEILDMLSDEAIEAAKAQFLSQNVDLSNIITDAYLYDGIDNHPFVKKFNKCKELAKEIIIDEDEIMSLIHGIVKEMETDKAKKLYVGNNGGYTLGVDILRAIAEQADPNPSRKFKKNLELLEQLELVMINWKMEEPSLTTTSRRSPPFTWS